MYILIYSDGLFCKFSLTVYPKMLKAESILVHQFKILALFKQKPCGKILILSRIEVDCQIP
jgi:hypothetical protein